MTQKLRYIWQWKKNGGYATFQQLNYLVDTSEWNTKTPDATIRRIVQNSTDFFKIKPGLWALEKYRERVLKDGCFLVEVLPAENENNYEYLYQIKRYAKKAGFLYYSKVSWKKGNFVSNTGRKAKNTQDIMIFSKGKARCMRLDKKKSDRTGEIHYMSGCNGMLPTMFNVQPVPRKNKIHQSELPVELCEEILEYVTYEGEIVLDSFAGSGAVGVAALNKKRSCILIEILKENIEKIRTRFNSVLYKVVLEG